MPDSDTHTAPTALPPPVYTGPELCRLSAVDAVKALESGEVSATEMLDAALSRIEAVEPEINAMPTLCPERARAHAAALTRGNAKTWLAGLPIGIKDLTPVAGVRTTLGSTGMANHVPDTSDPLVERLEQRGGIVLGKTNTPEMGAGGNTFNDVFGMTRNPWNTALNAGGSSGGAAASLATGEVWLSHGSDLAGSLRTPGAYCGVLGLRPSPGRCGGGPADYAFSIEGVQGPMARTAADCALFLDAMAGFDPRQPLSLPEPTTSFSDAIARAEPPKRIAFAPDQNGFAPVEPEVRDLLSAAMKRLEGTGTIVEEACPDLPGLYDCYCHLRGMFWAAMPGKLPAEITQHFKDTLKINISFGQNLTGDQMITAQRTRSRLYSIMEHFLRGYDALAIPVIGLASFPVETEFPPEVDGTPCEDYLDWLKFSFLATTVALPAISIPVGFTRNGAPMGIQMIGRPRGEAGLLQIARVMEQITDGFGSPIDPRS
ncbi:MAG: amidase [Pikeienuella sp.]